MAARQELHSGLSEMATQTQNYKLHKFELKDAPADITAINASMDIIDTQLKSLADGKFDKTGGTISGNLVVNGSTTLKKLTASELDLNGNADVSGTLKVTGATTLTGALAANGGVTTTTLKATGTSTLAAVNATNISASGTLKVTGATTLTGALAANGGLSTTTIKATGTSTLAAVNATNISASGTLNVTGTTTLTGKLTANGGVTTKSLTATSLDLNGNGDVSGSLTVHGDLNAQGSLNVTDITATGTLKVNGATSLTGLLTANGGVTTKKVTATELDLNGNADVSGTLTVHGATTLEAVQAKGNLTVGGLLNVTGAASLVGGGTVETPASMANDTSLVNASWVWSLIQAYGLSAGLDTLPESQDDLDLIDRTGFYNLSGQKVNTPTGAGMTAMVMHMQRRYMAGCAAFQLVPYSNRIYYRTKNNDTWGSWGIAAVDSSVVHLQGQETIEGTKEFAAGLRVQNFITYGSGSSIGLLSKPVSFPKGSNSNADEGFLIRVLDSSATSTTDKLLAEIAAFATADGSTVARLSASNNSAGQTGREFISITFDKTSGTYKTHAPTPVTGSHDAFATTTACHRPMRNF